MLVRWIGEPPRLNIAPLVPFRRASAAFNLLTLERAWFDGRGCFKCLGARRWLTFELSGPETAWPAKSDDARVRFAGQAVGGPLERRVSRHFLCRQ